MEECHSSELLPPDEISRDERSDKDGESSRRTLAVRSILKVKKEDITNIPPSETLSKMEEPSNGDTVSPIESPFIAALSARTTATMPLVSEADPQSKSELYTTTDKVDVVQPFESNKISMCSGGQRRVLAVAAALLTDPSVLLLDEVCLRLESPTNNIEQLMSFHSLYVRYSWHS